MRLILLGPPGAGKGTQATRVAERFEVPHIATGDLLRQIVAQETDLGREAKRYMDAGKLVPDGVVLQMLRDRLSQPDAQKGFLLDGFPRNRVQAEALDVMLAEVGHDIDAVVSIRVPDQEIIERISGRRSCPVCKRVYHTVSNPPANDGICDDDDAELVQREDDKPDVVQERLDVFHRQTAPLIEFYGDRELIRTIDGVGEVDEVSDRIAEALEGAGVS
ncbi:MAG TPA: adenylate kinase [Actinomycetota bacterium]